MTPAPTIAPSEYTTAVCPVATPKAGSSSRSSNPPAISTRVASTAGERCRSFASTRSERLSSRPSTVTRRRASADRGPTTTVFVRGSVATA